VDRLAEVLDEWGLVVALVHGGFSSVLALEPPAGRDGWPLTLSDPGDPSRVLTHLSARQTALGASGLRKGDHIVDPRTGEPARGRRAAWVAVPRPDVSRADAPAEGPRVAAAAVTDALTTACMLLSPEEIERICESTSGLQAWILPDPTGDREDSQLLRYGSSAD
jgi:FAD:protein FMN transferase